MEMSQRNPLYSYLKQKCFFSKTENRKVNQVLFGVGTSAGAGGGEDIRKVLGRVNGVKIPCTHV
jgi:hypothetical protein